MAYISWLTLNDEVLKQRQIFGWNTDLRHFRVIFEDINLGSDVHDKDNLW